MAIKKPSNLLTQQEYYRAHSIKRAKERYNLVLSEFVYRKMVEQVQSHKAEFIKRQDKLRSIFLIDKKFYVLYDKRYRCIRTFVEEAKIEA